MGVTDWPKGQPARVARVKLESFAAPHDASLRLASPRFACTCGLWPVSRAAARVSHHRLSGRAATERAESQWAGEHPRTASTGIACSARSAATDRPCVRPPARPPAPAKRGAHARIRGPLVAALRSAGRLTCSSAKQSTERQHPQRQSPGNVPHGAARRTPHAQPSRNAAARVGSSHAREPASQLRHRPALRAGPPGPDDEVRCGPAPRAPRAPRP